MTDEGLARIAPIEQTRSLCPVCLRSLPAGIVRNKESGVLLHRVCPEHGEFSGLIWRGEPDFAAWKRAKKKTSSVRRETERRNGCPHDCGRCPEHGQQACTVLFEITERCNLRCPVCFADAGRGRQDPFTPLETLKEQLAWIREHAGEVVLQLSGGEPTLHPSLPELVRAGRALFPAVQLNTNGLLLAERPEMAQELAEAGLAWVFLQFDGTSDDIFITLRGKPLLEKKLAAIKNCETAGLGVVLVPTLAVGVNDRDLGNLLRLALSLAPAVRGLHLQPMTLAGRNSLGGERRPFTLPEVLQSICGQSGGLMRPEHATPPGCEHERCSFHCRYRLTPSGGLTPLRGETPCCVSPTSGSPPNSASSPTGTCCGPADNTGEAESGPGGAQRAIEVILRAWQGPEKNAEAPGKAPDAFEAFIAESRNRTFSVTCMAFQDVWSADLERLQGCCVHVFAPPDRLVPFCAYNMTAINGTPLHRGSKH